MIVPLLESRLFVCPGLSAPLPNYVVLASVFAVAATLVVIVSHQNLLLHLYSSQEGMLFPML